MKEGHRPWEGRTIAEQKVLILAGEEAFVWELLPPITEAGADGPVQVYPELAPEVALTALCGLIDEEAVGVFWLDSRGHVDVLQSDAIALVQEPDVWRAGSGRMPSLFLRDLGAQIVG